MSIVAIGVEAALHDALHRTGLELDAPVAFAATVDQGRALVVEAHDTTLAVILGTRVDEPVQAIQRLSAVSANLPIVVLADAAAQGALTNALQFSPFVGPHVHCTEPDANAVVTELRRSVEDHKRRRRLAATLQALNAQLASSPASSYPPQREVSDYLAQVLDSAPIGIVATDESGVIRAWNRSAASLFGATEREALGTSLLELMPSLTTEQWTAILDGGPTSSIVERRLPAAASSQWLDVVASPLVGRGGRRGRLVLVQDITARVAAEQRLAVTLERETRAREEADAANYAKDQFLSVVSHELRTPLTAILCWVEVIRRTKKDDRRAAGLDIVERNGRAQAQLIEDLLDIGRITSGKMRLELEATDLAKVVEQAIASARPAADAKGVRLYCDLGGSPTHGNLDAARVQQVAWNLLSNAVKFTPRGGEVRVTLSREGDTLRLDVADDGEGMSAEFLPYVFDRFRQADSTFTRSRGGLGLGLAISRHLVELHGGTIEVRSAGAGRGSRFIVRLPAPATR